MTHAFYPGSFDPFTNGHLDVLTKALKLFDKVTIGVFENNLKSGRYMGADTSANLIKAIAPEGVNVVLCGSNSAVDECKRAEASIIVRGLRSVTDYEYELQIAMANKLIDPNIETVFVVPDIEHQFISSTIARELYRLEKFDQLKKIVPPQVFKYFEKEYRKYLNSQR